MAKNKPLIFITNDDGYQAKGINSLIESLIGLGEILVVAPDGPRSGMSSAITSIHPIRCYQVKNDEKNDVKIYACTGTPVDCVKLGISEIAGRQPDLLLSGINHGSNASICVHYSGTMGAAMEGAIFKVPSIGFSLLSHNREADFSHMYPITRSLCENVLKEGLPSGVCLNVNVPNAKHELKGVKVCRQAMGQWVEEFKHSEDGAGKKIYWLTGHFENDEPDAEDTDEWALANGYASIVPIDTDMTAHTYVKRLKEIEDIFVDQSV